MGCVIDMVMEQQIKELERKLELAKHAVTKRRKNEDAFVERSSTRSRPAGQRVHGAGEGRQDAKAPPLQGFRRN
jgi:DNA-binding protein H-NS